jgi:nucleoside-diphosphate-sugar epimerase
MPASRSAARYVARVDVASGRELPGPIEPRELLARAHRGTPALPLRFLASRAVSLTGGEWLLDLAQRGWTVLAGRVSSLWGHGATVFRFRPTAGRDEAGRKAHLQALRAAARRALLACGEPPRLSVVLTGATGFVGQQVLLQAARDPHVAEVVCVVRPLRRGDARGGRGGSGSARARGARLLARLGLEESAPRFRFVAGDIEKRFLGLSGAELRRLRRTATHLVHCAASVSFDAPYEESFRANVLGSRHAAELALDLQRAPGSRFVSYVALETSYVHGRAGHTLVREGTLSFPRGYYNNFYELTKAMATLETERALHARGLRVAQLLPSIVVGESRTGNNHGDAKVVNAPVNAFGRAREGLLGDAHRGWWGRLESGLASALMSAYPADGSAELNLVPVDRVAAGVLAALTAPDAVGRRIHLATDRRIRSDVMARIVREELEVGVRLSDPTVTRALLLPLARALLRRYGLERLAQSLERLGSVFEGYSDWGQPIHGVGDDVKVLALPARRPDTVQVFRMVCRHNRYVQAFGAVRDADEVARRERVWRRAVDDIEYATGRDAAALPPAVFRRLLQQRVDTATLRWREG